MNPILRRWSRPGPFRLDSDPAGFITAHRIIPLICGKTAKSGMEWAVPMRQGPGDRETRDG